MVKRSSFSAQKQRLLQRCQLPSLSETNGVESGVIKGWQVASEVGCPVPYPGVDKSRFTTVRT